MRNFRSGCEAQEDGVQHRDVEQEKLQRTIQCKCADRQIAGARTHIAEKKDITRHEETKLEKKNRVEAGVAPTKRYDIMVNHTAWNLSERPQCSDGWIVAA